MGQTLCPRLSLTWRAFIQVYFSVRQLLFRDHFGRFIFVLFFVFYAGNAIYLYVGVHSLGAEKVICFQNHMASFYSNSPHYPSCSALESGEFVLLCQFPKCSVYSFLVFIICLFSNVSLTICQVVIASIVFFSWCAIFS